MTVALVVPQSANMPGYSTSDLDEAHSLSSDYSYSQTMVPPTSGMFSFAHTEPSTDLLNGSSWGVSVEGPQNFQDYPDNGSSHSGEAEEYIITSGHTTPRGTKLERTQVSETAWTSAGLPSSLSSGSLAMSRMNSNKSSVSSLSHSSRMSNVDVRGNATFRNGSQTTGPIDGIESCLLLDADATSVPSVFWNGYNNLGVGLDSDSAPFSLADPSPLHMVPSQMHLGTDANLPENSSPGSWPSFTSSRTSSPATIDDATWLHTQRPQSPNSTPEMPCQSPSTTFDSLANAEDVASLAPLSASMSIPSTFGSRREGESARDHELYKNAAPREDGLYHCPWEGEASCTHKPEKLKCNYDKFVDSHLKPYRCKADSCEGARFSSTACLLRHEREAHGLHGHGDKPFLCHYEGCERSIIGNGFPRQWNLKDHMKRVHNDHGSSSGSPPSTTGPTQPSKGRKRKTDSPETQVTSSRKASQRSVSKESKQPSGKPLLEQWLEQRKAVEDMLRDLDKPEDSQAITHLTEMQRRLSMMTRMASELGAQSQDNVVALTNMTYASIG